MFLNIWGAFFHKFKMHMIWICLWLITIQGEDYGFLSVWLSTCFHYSLIITSRALCRNVNVRLWVCVMRYLNPSNHNKPVSTRFCLELLVCICVHELDVVLWWLKLGLCCALKQSCVYQRLKGKPGRRYSIDMSHTQRDATKLLSTISSFLLSLCSFCLIFSSGAALVFSHTPSHAICPAPSFFFFFTYPPPSHLLCLSISISPSKTRTIAVYLLLTSCTFLFLPLSQHLYSLFPFWYPPLARSPHSIYEHISRSPPHPSSLPIFISSLSGSPSLSPCMPICLYLLSPSLSGLRSHKRRVQREEWTWNGKLFISDSSAAALSTTPDPTKTRWR